MADYKVWAGEVALPYIREHLDRVGFWVNIDEPAQVNGKAQDDLGPATVTWIIRWEDIETRHEVMGKVFATDEWSAIMQRNPGQGNYLCTEAKFAEAL